MEYNEFGALTIASVKMFNHVQFYRFVTTKWSGHTTIIQAFAFNILL